MAHLSQVYYLINHTLPTLQAQDAEYDIGWIGKRERDPPTANILVFLPAQLDVPDHNGYGA